MLLLCGGGGGCREIYGRSAQYPRLGCLARGSASRRPAEGKLVEGKMKPNRQSRIERRNGTTILLCGCGGCGSGEFGGRCR